MEVKNQVKKLIVIVIAIIALLAVSAPAMAAVDTSVNISTGGGSIPVVKCKWEQEPITSLESGDPSHLAVGTQINPPLVHLATKPIQYYAVVTDVEEGGNVLQVYSYVYHPADSPAPYNADVAPGGPYFKYKVEYVKVGHDLAARNLVIAANTAGLVTFDPDFDINEITGPTGEMIKGTADLWMGTEIIDFEQPAGDYPVYVYAVDHNSNTSPALYNTFNYVPLGGIEIDFTSVSYGPVSLTVEKTIAGDTIWDPAGATVRNIGNTWVYVTVAQDDMYFGKVGTLPATAYKGSVAPTPAQSNWNVYFDLRMGNDVANEMWYDPTAKGSPMTNVVQLPNFLGLSMMDELDFSINVLNGTGAHTGSMVLGYVVRPFSEGGTPSGVPSH